jgi:hypothetical protein
MEKLMARLCIAFLFVSTFSLNAFAETILYDSQGFESPTFASGQTPVGQDESNPWQAFGGSPAAFQVESGFAASGTQAVQGNGGGLNDGAFVWPDLHYTSASNEKVRIQVDIARTLSANVADSSPVYAVDIYDFDFNRTTRFGLQNQSGVIRAFVSVPIDGAGQIDPNGPGIRPEFVGPPVAENTFVHFDFLMNYAAKTVTLSMDGTVVAAGLPFRTGSSTTLDSAELQVGTFNNQSADHGWFDNYVVSTVPAIPGDFDNNDVVDAADLAKWQADFGAGNGSDADDDGDTDGNDFLIWQRQLGVTAAGVHAVPEPATACAAFVAALVVVAWRRRPGESRGIAARG